MYYYCLTHPTGAPSILRVPSPYHPCFLHTTSVVHIPLAPSPNHRYRPHTTSTIPIPQTPTPLHHRRSPNPIEIPLRTTRVLTILKYQSHQSIRPTDSFHAVRTLPPSALKNPPSRKQHISSRKPCLHPHPRSHSSLSRASKSINQSTNIHESSLAVSKVRVVHYIQLPGRR